MAIKTYYIVEIQPSNSIEWKKVDSWVSGFDMSAGFATLEKAHKAQEAVAKHMEERKTWNYTSDVEKSLTYKYRIARIDFIKMQRVVSE